MFNSVYNVSIHHTCYYLRHLLCLWNTTLNRIESLRSDLIRIYRFANNLLRITDQWPQSPMFNPQSPSIQFKFNLTCDATMWPIRVSDSLHYTTQLNPDSWSVAEAYNNPRHEVRSDTVPLSITVITECSYLCITLYLSCAFIKTKRMSSHLQPTYLPTTPWPM